MLGGTGFLVFVVTNFIWRPESFQQIVKYYKAIALPNDSSFALFVMEWYVHYSVAITAN